MKVINLYEIPHARLKAACAISGRTLPSTASLLISHALDLIDAGQLDIGKLEEADHKRNQAKPEPK